MYHQLRHFVVEALPAWAPLRWVMVQFASGPELDGSDRGDGNSVFETIDGRR